MSEAVTATEVPAFTVENEPACVNVTVSPLMMPFKLPPVNVATAVPSYVFVETVVPSTVNAFAVMLAVNPVGCVSV